MILPNEVQLVVVVGGFIVMLAGLCIFHSRLKAKNQGFGPNSIKALGMILLIPNLLIIAVAVPSFQSETLAALLGTIAGYTLSQSKSED